MDRRFNFGGQERCTRSQFLSVSCYTTICFHRMTFIELHFPNRTAANKAVTGESKQQLDLIVAAQEIAACTAQLVVASRVKAPRGSSNLSALGQASRNVTQATGAVVATAKDCGQRLEDSQDMDLANLTVHQAKTLEMEIQVKVLELEQALQMERSRLATFRRKNYREN